MKFDTVLFKDKSDLNDFVADFPGCLTLGTYEKTQSTYPGVKILSVKSSKVGKTTLARFPDLEWVVCRSHGYDNVNLMDCNARNVGVVTTSPTAENCARWCVSNIDEKSDLVVLFGNGAIGNRVLELLGNRPVIVITSRSENPTGLYVYATRAINASKFPTIIVTVPLNKSTEGLIGGGLLDNVTTPTQIISISRDGVFDDDSLIEFTNAGKLRNGHFDMISTRVRNELKDRINYYSHTSWTYGVDSEIVNPVKVIVPALLDGDLLKLPKNSIKLTRLTELE